MIVNAYAKINLGIDIIGKRDDGYHNIDMVTIPLELHDSLEIFEIPNKNRTFITSDDATLVCDETNLAYKALNIMNQHFDAKRSYRIHIYKRIPSEAGLGGGSADAAAVIRVMCKILKKNPLSEEIMNLASQVGSDVPFCIENVPAHIEGMGEKVTHINLKKSYYVLIATPPRGLSTKLVYDQFDKKDYPSSNNKLKNLIESLESDSLPLKNEDLFNALELPAIDLYPDIKILLTKIKELGIPYFGVSGSGSSCYMLHSDKNKLEQTSEILSKLGYKTQLTSFLGHKKFLKSLKKRK